MKKIPLTQGKFALVDDEDFHYLSRFNWCMVVAKKITGEVEHYVVRRITTYHKQQFLIGIEYFISSSGDKRGTRVFHKNGNPLDCQKENLAYMMDAVAVHNKRKTKMPRTSKWKGVSLHHQANGSVRWVSKLGYRGKSLWCGAYDNEDDAARAYDAKARELYGEHAYQNFPQA